MLILSSHIVFSQFETGDVVVHVTTGLIGRRKMVLGCQVINTLATKYKMLEKLKMCDSDLTFLFPGRIITLISQISEFGE